MTDDSDNDSCNCYECYAQPKRSFKIREGRNEQATISKTEISGLKRGFYLPKKATDDVVTKEARGDVGGALNLPADTLTQVSTKHKTIHTSMPETIKCEKVANLETSEVEEKVDIKCTKCIESNEAIDIINQGAFQVMCTDGCSLTLHRNCFEKALGSGKKKELKSCMCPTDDCGCSVTVINHRIPGRSSDFSLWLRCEVKECERPKKEDKVKEIRKKDEKKEKDKYKKDGVREEEERRRERVERVEDGSTSSAPSIPCASVAVEERAVISLALPFARDDDAKKNLIKPLPADLEARPIERKEDALMSKYAVKETIMKENRRKNKKEVRQVVLPGLTVKGQRGKKEEEEEWSVNDVPSVSDEVEGNSANGVGMRRENTDMRYEESPYGFAMPEELEEVQHVMPFEAIRRYEEMAPSNVDYSHNSLFHHPLPIVHGGIFRPVHFAEADVPPAFLSQPVQDSNGRCSLGGFTESPVEEEPPLIENPFDYPTLERDWVRDRKDLANFFEIHTPVLEENAALFDSPQIDLDQLKNMLDNFIEFQFYGNEEEKRNMAHTLHTIFTGDVENDIIPFLIDLHCFKYGYVDGRLVVSIKTEGIQRREREEQTRRRFEEEERRKKKEEDRKKREIEEEERRREEKKREEVRRAVMELEDRRRKEIEEREESIRVEDERQKKIREARREEEERKDREKRRKEEEERRQLHVEQRRKEEAEEKERRAVEERRLREEKEEKKNEELERKDSEVEDEIRKKILSEKRKKEEEDRQKRMEELMAETGKLQNDLTSKKDNDKKTKEKMLERNTREAINYLRKNNQANGSSSESSPERKQLLSKCTRPTGSSSVAPPLSSSSSSSFSTSAPTFVPRCTNHKAELNPNAPAFVPTLSTMGVSPLIDENGTEVDNIWLDDNKQTLEKNKSTIEELNSRIIEMENEKKKMEFLRDEDKKKLNERMNEDKKKGEVMAQLESRVREMNEQMIWKDKTISQISMESEKKLEELNRIQRAFDLEMEDMKSKFREANATANREMREKENVMEMKKRGDDVNRRLVLERKRECAREALLMVTHIINRLAVDPEAQVMTSIFIDLRKKWTDHHSILNQSLNAYERGESIDLEMLLSLKEPSMPRETDELVKECYVWHYQTMHTLSFRLAAIVKKCLIEHKRFYEDVYIIGIIQKWMKIHKDPTKIDATVPQVANMVAQAMGDVPLLPPKYVYVSRVTPSSLSRVPTLHTDRMTSIQTRNECVNKLEPKGWKKASDKVRQVDMRDHECSICLEDTAGGVISYCENVSCNEPYHNDCLEKYWKTGGLNCPRCRTPMPPRDAFPALG